MKFLGLVKDFIGIPKIVKSLMLSSLALTVARAMSIPFFAIYLSLEAGLEPSDIGLFIGSAIFISTATGAIGGMLSDTFGKRAMLLISLLSCSLSLCGLYFSNSLLLLYLSNLFFNIGYSIFSPVSKSIISEKVDDSIKVRAFSINYILINVGWAVGPLLGVWLTGESNKSIFLAASLIFFLVFLYYLIFVSSEENKGENVEPPSIYNIFHVLSRDKYLLLFIVGGIVLSTVYSQFTVYLSQYFIISDHVTSAKYLSYMLTTNALCIIFVQPLIIGYTERISPNVNIFIGGCLLALGQIGFFLSGDITHLIIAMVVFSVGEILIIPNQSVVIDRIAPNEMKGAYFGAQNLQTLGYFLCPWISLLTLERYGSNAMFLTLSGLSVVGALLFAVKRREDFKLSLKVKQNV
ncbi:MFS transporter [Photobacterium leiognathi]|uniref:MFS transporter n=1 Tax=Photobacterium leiognathi TaxID=553611 RepID=UPI00273A1B90|nr:MFS transporter [Photobacterium leiognathi]